MKNKKSRKYHDQIVTAWNLMKRFCEREGHDETFWDDFASALTEPQISDMCKTLFGLDLVYAVKRELERQGAGK